MMSFQRLRRFGMIFIFVSLLFAEKSDSNRLNNPIVHTYLLGEEKVWVYEYQQPGIDITLINLHDNENTAAKAGLAFIQKYGGRLIELRHGRGREVVVRLNGELNRFDPNRMFSDTGLRASLKYFHNNTEQVFNHATAFRDSIIQLLAADKNKTVISVHNNTPDRMTIHDFLPGRWYGNDTQKVFINPEQDHDDFFIVSSTILYTALLEHSYNVALLAKKPSDRGMLMSYCSNLGSLCITVEAEHGKLNKQQEMLEVLWEILSKKGTYK